MLIVIAFIINLFAPIVDIIGAIGLLGAFIFGDFYIFIYGAILAILGLVFGIAAFRNDIPPRWSWSKSKNQLFTFAVTAVLKYMWSFAAWPFAIYIISVVIGMFGA